MREKSLELRILSELLKNSSLNEKQLAEALRASEATIVRTRARVEEKLIDGYTVVPKWKEIGFEIVAFTLIKGRKDVYLKSGKYEEAVRIAKEWFEKRPNVVFASAGNGIGWDGLFISFHKSYSEFVRFKKEHDDELRGLLVDSQSFIVDTDPNSILKSFHLKYLADAL